MKVLLKFKLLEVQRQLTNEFTQWAIATPYFEQIRTRFFMEIPMKIWVEQLYTELVAAGVAGKDGAYIVNG